MLDSLNLEHALATRMILESCTALDLDTDYRLLNTIAYTRGYRFVRSLQ